MAAHLKTGIEQVLEQIEREGETDYLKQTLEGAVKMSCWTEDDTGVWYLLYDYVQEKIGIESLETQLRRNLERVTDMWDRLGKPDTREEWWRAKYG